MSARTICAAIIVGLAVSCSGDDTPLGSTPPRAGQQTTSHGSNDGGGSDNSSNGSQRQDSCAQAGGGIGAGGDDFGFDNDNPPTGIITPTI